MGELWLWLSGFSGASLVLLGVVSHLLMHEVPMLLAAVGIWYWRKRRKGVCAENQPVTCDEHVSCRTIRIRRGEN
jgi:hypothetical protein